MSVSAAAKPPEIHRVRVRAYVGHDSFCLDVGSVRVRRHFKYRPG